MDGQLLVDFLRCHRTDDAIEFSLRLLVGKIIGVGLLHSSYDSCFADPKRVVRVG